jgi:hypothetical protein
VGTKVLVLYGHEWAREYWSTRRMGGYESAGPLRACLIHFFAGTLTCVNLLEMIVGSVLPPNVRDL